MQVMRVVRLVRASDASLTLGHFDPDVAKKGHERGVARRNDLIGSAHVGGGEGGTVPQCTRHVRGLVGWVALCWGIPRW